jgi:hypothetical protein
MTTEAITPPRKRMIEDMNARKLCAGTQRGHIRATNRCRSVESGLDDVKTGGWKSSAARPSGIG